MKNKLLQLATGLALMALLGKFYAQPLLAQVRAALVQNVDEPGRHPFALRARTNSFTVGDRTSASWNVPAGQRYVIETYGAICGVDAPATLADISVLVRHPDVFDIFASTAPHLTHNYVLIDGVAHQLNNSMGSGVTRLYAEPGDQIILQTLNSTGNIAISRECFFTVSGSVITLP